MFEKLRTYILPDLIPRNSKLLVAVSGGPDSMALGHILWRYMCEDLSRGISLVITHVHHGVRKESDQELILVQQVADKWNVPCRIHRFDSKGYAKAMGQSFQEAAREWRYAKWREDMHEEGCTHLATAHHLGDQAETILYRLLRGSGTAGLAGIYPSKDSIIRPLLTFTKADILDYCKQENLPYGIDASNEQPVYVRNRIRLELIPVLEKDYNPRIQETLGRTGQLLRWDEDYLAKQSEKAWAHYYLRGRDRSAGLTLDVFKEPEAILSRLLRKAAMLVSEERRGLSYSYVTKIMASKGKHGWMQDLPGITVKINEEGIWFNTKCDEESIGFEGIGGFESLQSSFNDIILVPGEWSEIPGTGAKVALFTEEDYLASVEGINASDCEVAVFDRDLLTMTPNSLICRTRRQGDKMWFKGVGHKSLKKVFQEAKIPASKRHQFPLIVSGNEVYWIPRLRQSGLWRPVQHSSKVYFVFKAQTGSSNLNSL